jgi:hypothetical protein
VAPAAHSQSHAAAVVAAAAAAAVELLLQPLLLLLQLQLLLPALAAGLVKPTPLARVPTCLALQVLQWPALSAVLRALLHLPCCASAAGPHGWLQGPDVQHQQHQQHQQVE